MEQVTFTYKNGIQRNMTPREAHVLEILGEGYLTRDMAKFPAVRKLEDMTREELHKLAKERGIKVHHASGADKVRAALK
jgi:hypothetical protein